MKCEISAGMHLGKFWLDQIQNGPLSAIIYFHMPDILQTVLDVSPLLYNKIWGFGGGCILKKIDLIKSKMAAFSAIIHFHMADIW